jgi:hypothetical protein
MRTTGYRILAGVLSLALGWLFLAGTAQAANRKCPPFHLKTDDGKIINPLTGENADQPYSSRQTCGPCHNYDEITKGFHFQQGWDKIRDDFGKAAGKPWVLSDGMAGKM